MKRKLSLAIDVGTSNVKFLVANEKFEQVYFNSVSYKVENEDKFIKEIDPLVWKKILIEELKKIFEYNFSKNITNICATAQMHTTLFLDKNGKAIRKAIMWDDKRNYNKVSQIKDELLKKCNKLHEANIVANGNPLVNLLWVKDREKDKYNCIHKICFVKDYINMVLTGKIATDYSDASTSGLFNLEKKNWDKDIIRYYDINEQILPEIKKSDDLVGLLSKEIKDELGIKNKIEILAGMADNAATFYAIKKLKNSDVAISLGTSAVLIRCIDYLNNKGKNIVLLTNTEEYLCNQSTVATSGSAIDWWNKIIKSSKFLTIKEIEAEKLYENDTIFLPYLSGEKYILKNSNMKGAFLGLTRQTSREDFLLAVLEGISFAIKLLSDSYKDKNISEIVLVGGGSKNDLWTKIIASVMNNNIIKFNIDLMSVHGAALLALKSNKSLEFNNIKYKCIKPDKNLYIHYYKKYEIFKKYIKLLNI